MLIVSNHYLFPDAKSFEDGMENFIGGDGAAGDFGKMEEGGAHGLLLRLFIRDICHTSQK